MNGDLNDIRCNFTRPTSREWMHNRSGIIFFSHASQYVYLRFSGRKAQDVMKRTRDIHNYTEATVVNYISNRQQEVA